MASTRGEWRPAAPLANLALRARILGEMRAFFAARGVMEVETPILSAAATTDPHLESFSSRYVGPEASGGLTLYLQTSPEFPMKRLLAAGSGPIYQISRVFRQGEFGRLHNPEFTMLEWYRLGYDHHDLMEEVEALVRRLLGSSLGQGERLSYSEAFLRHAGIEPHEAEEGALKSCARRHGIAPVGELEEKDAWLDLLMTHLVEPRLGRNGPTFIYDYPASQAALARIRPGPPAVAERFELYLEGKELANGFHELADADEQRRRFELDKTRRRSMGLPDVPMDEHLLAALESGLPPCAGVALGVDRLVMVAAGAARLDEVIAFPLSSA